MSTRLTATTILFLLSLLFRQVVVAESNDDAMLATGTLNLVIANKNGIVVVADSRMSSENPFPCGPAMR